MKTILMIHTLIGAVNSFTPFTNSFTNTLTNTPPTSMSRAFVRSHTTTVRMADIDEDIDIEAMTLEEEVRTIASL